MKSEAASTIRYPRHSDAIFCIGEHAGRPGLIATLRQMLAEQHHPQARRPSDKVGIYDVARRLLNGFEKPASLEAEASTREVDTQFEVQEVPPSSIENGQSAGSTDDKNPNTPR